VGEQCVFAAQGTMAVDFEMEFIEFNLPVRVKPIGTGVRNIAQNNFRRSIQARAPPFPVFLFV